MTTTRSSEIPRPTRVASEAGATIQSTVAEVVPSVSPLSSVTVVADGFQGEPGQLASLQPLPLQPTRSFEVRLTRAAATGPEVAALESRYAQSVMRVAERLSERLPQSIPAFGRGFKVGVAGWFDPASLWGSGSGQLAAPWQVLPSKALADLADHLESAAFECESGALLALNLALLDLVGPQAFDGLIAKHGGLKIGPGMGSQSAIGRLSAARIEADLYAPMTVGTWTYFENPGYLPEQADFRGENVIYLGTRDGQPLFYGHPLGICTEAEIIDTLREYQKPRSPTPHRSGRRQGLDLEKIARELQLLGQ